MRQLPMDGVMLGLTNDLLTLRERIPGEDLPDLRLAVLRLNHLSVANVNLS